MGASAVMSATEGDFKAGLYATGTDKNIYLQPMKKFSAALTATD